MFSLPKAIASLAHAISALVVELQHQNNNQVILQRIEQVERTIMSAISDFAAKQNAFNDRVDTAVAGITSDVDALTAKIVELQNTSGSITAEDQALLDAIQARSEAVATKLEALDALNEKAPTPPVA